MNMQNQIDTVDCKQVASIAAIQVKPNPNNAYVVFPPPGAFILDSNGQGVHLPFGNTFVVIIDPLFYASINAITETISHEIVESMTNPNYDTPAFLTKKYVVDTGDEIVDTCAVTKDFNSVLNGINVGRYWSNQDGGCWP